MKRIYKPLLVAALTLAAAVSLTQAAPAADEAAPPPHPRMKQMREQRMKQMEETLHLTAEQKTQIVAIWDKAEQQAREQHQADKAAMEDHRAKRREAMRAVREQVRAVLTPEQQKAFDEMPHGNPPPPMPAGNGEGR